MLWVTPLGADSIGCLLLGRALHEAKARLEESSLIGPFRDLGKVGRGTYQAASRVGDCTAFAACGVV